MSRLILLIILIVMFIVNASCGMFQLSGRKYIGSIEKLSDGAFEIQVKLEKRLGWTIHTGDPSASDFGKSLIDNNKSIMNKRLSLTVINNGKYDLRLWALDGEKIIKPNSNIVYFQGTLESLLTDTNPIALSGTKFLKYNFTLKYQFEEKNIKIEQPIPIVATWSK